MSRSEAYLAGQRGPSCRLAEAGRSSGQPEACSGADRGLRRASWPTPEPACFRPTQVPGCDKNMPGCLMAMARVNRPSVMVYGGTIRAGCRPDRTDDKLDIISAFEAYGKFTAGAAPAQEAPAFRRPP